MAATKAIYTKVAGKYYKVNQDTVNPKEIIRMPRTHSQMSADQAGRVINSNIWINTLDGKLVYSNKELYTEMTDYLKLNKVKEISTIQNNFVMYVDYSVFNMDGKEINHNAFVRPIKPRDAVYNLGVNQESELIYKQIKTFMANIALNVKNEYPMGIMYNSSAIKYTLQINDVSIYQDLVYEDSDVHLSSDTDSYPIATVLESMVKVYSTHDNGMVISAVEVPFIPRKIILDVHITLDDLIVVYDDQNIKDILDDNLDIEDVLDPEQVVIFNGGSAHE